MDGSSSPQPTALVIDDSAACRAMVTAVLHSAGWRVIEAPDGESGAEIALSRALDAIVCDHQMLSITGTQLCRLLSADERTSRIPVVVLTATTTRRGLFWAVESGASAYVSKNDVRRLPAVLEQVRRAARISSTNVVARGPVRSVASRLGDLLDATLFECVLRGKVRGIGALESTMAGVFRRVASLLGSIIEFRWCAVALRGHVDQGWVMARDDDRLAVSEARDALALRERSVVERVDEDQCVPRSSREASIVLPLEFAGEVIGSIAVVVGEGCVRSEAEQTMAIVASELPAVIQLALLIERTTRSAMYDELTSVANRRAARDFLERAVVAARRHALPLSVALLDIDHFKRVNDTHGHESGDAVLRAVSAAVQSAVRRSDFVARWGGEEFLLVFPHTGVAGASVVCERVRAVVESLSFDGALRGLRVSASMGLASLDEEGVDSLVRRADEALYRAKGRGRNRVELGDAPLSRVG